MECNVASHMILPIILTWRPHIGRYSQAEQWCLFICLHRFFGCIFLYFIMCEHNISAFKQYICAMSLSVQPHFFSFICVFDNILTSSHSYVFENFIVNIICTIILQLQYALSVSTWASKLIMVMTRERKVIIPECRERYQIIKGICGGLHYLHESRIFHLDLKPENVLLDNNMVPKITDFSLSRCFEEKIKPGQLSLQSS